MHFVQSASSGLMSDGNDVLDPLRLKLIKMGIDYDFQNQPNARLKKNEIPKYFDRFRELCNS